MNVFKGLLIACMSLFFTGARGQMTKDNSQWTFEAVKKGGNKYEIIAHLKLEKGWHVFSLKPGGDGSLISPSISFNKNPKVKLVGSLKEKGKLISEKVEGVQGTINMYDTKVDYTQAATVDGATVITGTYKYQICNDRMCLPPAEKTFTITVK